MLLVTLLPFLKQQLSKIDFSKFYFSTPNLIIMRKFLGLFIFTLLSSAFAFAGQTVEITHDNIVVNEPSTSNNTGNSFYQVGCDEDKPKDNDNIGFFSDRPGNHKPYMNNSDYYTTICPDAGRLVSVNFQQFNLEKFDKLTIWDESPSVRDSAVTVTVEDKKTILDNTPETLDIYKPGHPKKKDKDDGIIKIGSYTGPSSPGKITSSLGCLTFRFESDGSVVKTGWYAKIECSTEPVADPCPKFEEDYVDSELKCGVTITDDNFRGANNFETYGSCTMPGWPSKGRELIYKFVNYSASDLTFTLEESNGSQPKGLNMFILDDCDVTACTDSLLRPAQNASQGIETITIKNAPAGTYYVVVDGNQTYLHNSFKLTVECAGGDYTTCTDPYYYDDFEADDKNVNRPRPDIDYAVGDYISIVNPYWTRGGGVGLRDGRISDDRSSNGKNSLEINRNEEATQDVFLDLGQKFKGVYRLAFDLYIESHSTAFFGIFGGDNSDPWGSISKEFGHNNGFEGRWFDVEVFVDLDKNKYTMYIDNRCYVSSGDYYLNLNSLNFYGLPKAHFYVDNLCFGPVKKIPAAGSISRLAIDMSTPIFEEALVLQAEVNYGGGVTDNATSEIGLTVDNLVADDLKVMPNPTTGSTLIALDLDNEQTVQLQIFSPTGQLVRNMPLGKTSSIRQEVDLSDLSNGLYILRATGEQSVISKKIILQK